MPVQKAPTIFHSWFIKKPSTVERTITVADGSPSHPKKAFPSNHVKTTRYTPQNFFFLNLVEQFSRPLNIYFVFVGCLQLISVITPVNPASTLVPLAVVFLLTMAKDLLDDVKRAKADKLANERPTHVLKKASPGAPLCVTTVHSSAVKVGQIVLLRGGEVVPADTLLLTTAGEEDTAYIMTANLDGEIDLKPRVALPELQRYYGPDAAVPAVATPASPESRHLYAARPALHPSLDGVGGAISSISCTVLAPAPCVDLYSVNCTVTLSLPDSSETVTLSTSKDNFIPASCQIAPVTSWVYGLVLYTGHETKTALSNQAAPTKWANVDKTLSKLSGFIFALQMFVAFGIGGVGLGWQVDESQKHWYLSERPSSAKAWYEWLIVPARFFLLTSVMIPISFKAIIDASKWWVSQSISYDSAMYLPYERLASKRSAADSARVDAAHGRPPSVTRDVAVGDSGVARREAAAHAVAISRIKRDGRDSGLDDVPAVASDGLFKSLCGAPSDASRESMCPSGDAAADYEPDVPALPCSVANSSIAEDLGQIEFVLSDKTGTFTRNAMQLKAMWCLSAPEEGDPSLNMGIASHAVYGTVRLANWDHPQPAESAWAAQEPATPATIGFPSAGQTAATPQLCDALLAIALCNTVDVHIPAPMSPLQATKHDGPLYRAISPDEEALVLAASRGGVVLSARTRSSVTVNVLNQSITYSILRVLPFTPERRRMSVVVRRNGTSPSGNPYPIELLIKGSDDMILPRLLPIPHILETVDVPDEDGPLDGARDSKYRGALPEVLHQFSVLGLRTLVIGRRELSPSLFQSWGDELHAAEVKVTGAERESVIHSFYSQLEAGISVISVSAVEDMLQEGVPETIAALRSAGIRVWMLTGDKPETAAQIAASAALVSPANGERVIPITGASTAEILKQISRASALCPDGPVDEPSSFSGSFNEDGVVELLSRRAAGHDEAASAGASQTNLRTRNRPNVSFPRGSTTHSIPAICLLIQGSVLETIITEPSCTKPFLDLITRPRCTAVVACRMSPFQKAMVVSLVKQTGRITLAIGDGGNDVAMIREAHVGVGIRGKEGSEASRAADFAIDRFRYLRNLLLVHGHWSYHRTCFIVQYCYYKSMLVSIIQVAFNFTTGFSGMTYWNSALLTLWNGLFTLSNIFLYVLDCDLPASTLINKPSLYKWSRTGQGLTTKTFLYFVIMGMLQGIFLLLYTFGTYGDSITSFLKPNGFPMPLSAMFTPTYSVALVLQAFVVTLHSHSITWINAIAIWGIIPLYFGTIAVLSAMPYLDYYSAVSFMFSGSDFMLFLVLGVTVLFLPQYCISVYRRNYGSDLRYVLCCCIIFVCMSACCTRQRSPCSESVLRKHPTTLPLLDCMKSTVSLCPTRKKGPPALVPLSSHGPTRPLLGDRPSSTESDMV